MRMRPQPHGIDLFRALVLDVRADQFLGKHVSFQQELVVDLERFPDWNPTTKSARKLSAGETGEPR